MHVRHPSAELRARLPVSFYAFDVLHLDGASLLAAPYDERRARLAELQPADRVLVPPTFDDVDGDQLLAVARQHGLEGVVAKRRAGRYEPGRRSPGWVKTALVRTQEVLVGGFTAGEGRRTATLRLAAARRVRRRRRTALPRPRGHRVLRRRADRPDGPPAPARPGDQPLRRGGAARARPQGPLGGTRPGRRGRVPARDTATAGCGTPRGAACDPTGSRRRCGCPSCPPEIRSVQHAGARAHRRQPVQAVRHVHGRCPVCTAGARCDAGERHAVGRTGGRPERSTGCTPCACVGGGWVGSGSGSGRRVRSPGSRGPARRWCARC